MNEPRGALSIGALSRLVTRKARSAGRRARWRLIEALEPRRPNAIKIDVDGRLLAGARETMSHPGLRSVLVEAWEAGLPPGSLDLLRHAGFSRIDTAHHSEAANERWVR